MPREVARSSEKRSEASARVQQEQALSGTLSALSGIVRNPKGLPYTIPSLDILCILISMLFTWVYTVFNIHKTVCLMYSVCKFYLNLKTFFISKTPVWLD